MPLRAPKMYGFIFGFQRLVWCPKWTPASRSCFIEMAVPVEATAAAIVSAPVVSAGAAGAAGAGALVVSGAGVLWISSDMVFSGCIRHASC